MAILLSGDFHNGACGEMRLINRKRLLSCYEKELYDKIKYHIILGDAGFLWPEYNDYKNIDLENFKELSERKFPILCVMGNHEPVYGMTDLPEEDIGIGEKVIVVNRKNPFVAYLKRGKIYQIDGYKVLVLGGALSTDKDRRVEGESWWKEEYWSDEERADIFKLLKNENEFDFVLSHTGPHSVNRKLAGLGVPNRHGKMDDKVGELNDEIDKRTNFRAWFCGHWHYDYLDDFMGSEDDLPKTKKYCYLYNYTALIEDDKLILSKAWGVLTKL